MTDLGNTVIHANDKDILAILLHKPDKFQNKILLDSWLDFNNSSKFPDIKEVFKNVDETEISVVAINCLKNFSGICMGIKHKEVYSKYWLCILKNNVNQKRIPSFLFQGLGIQWKIWPKKLVIMSVSSFWTNKRG